MTFRREGGGGLLFIEILVFAGIFLFHELFTLRNIQCNIISFINFNR